MGVGVGVAVAEAELEGDEEVGRPGAIGMLEVSITIPVSALDGGMLAVSTTIPDGALDGNGTAVEVKSLFGTLRRAGSVALGAAEARALASPTRSERPSNVTSAFSIKHDRLALLNRAKITSGKRGMEKFAWAAVRSRGMESPSVTFG